LKEKGTGPGIRLRGEGMMRSEKSIKRQGKEMHGLPEVLRDVGIGVKGQVRRE